jgi:hypothetical protein
MCACVSLSLSLLLSSFPFLSRQSTFPFISFSTPSTLAHPFSSCFSRTLPIAISQYSVSRSLGSPFSAWVGFSEPKEARKPEKEPCERKKYVNGFTTTFTRCSLAHAHTGHTLDTAIFNKIRPPPPATWMCFWDQKKGTHCRTQKLFVSRRHRQTIAHAHTHTHFCTRTRTHISLVNRSETTHAGGVYQDLASRKWLCWKVYLKRTDFRPLTSQGSPHKEPL